MASSTSPAEAVVLLTSHSRTFGPREADLEAASRQTPHFSPTTSVQPALRWIERRGRSLSRHGEAIANVLAYRVKGDLHDADVLVFLTPAELIAHTDLSTE